MKYLFTRLSCALHGHQWHQTTSPAGNFLRCWRCYLER
jgi:hypothetical protein